MGYLSISLFSTLLLIASYTDLKERVIPDTVCIGIGILSLFSFHPQGILAALPFYIAGVINPKKLGGGDIKLVAAVGLYMGFYNALFGAMIGLSLSILIYYTMALFHKNSDKKMPLAPFLTIGFLTTLLI